MRLILIGILVACAVALPQEGRTQGTATTSVQPVRWEYLTVIEQMGRMALTDGKTQVTWQGLGDQGWEFVAFDNQFGNHLLIFKRIKP